VSPNSPSINKPEKERKGGSTSVVRRKRGSCFHSAPERAHCQTQIAFEKKDVHLPLPRIAPGSAPGRKKGGRKRRQVRRKASKSPRPQHRKKGKERAFPSFTPTNLQHRSRPFQVGGGKRGRPRREQPFHQKRGTKTSAQPGTECPAPESREKKRKKGGSGSIRNNEFFRASRIFIEKEKKASACRNREWGGRPNVACSAMK